MKSSDASKTFTYTLICNAIWEILPHGKNFNILSSYYHVKDFNLLFLKVIKFCVYDTYIQSLCIIS